MGPSPQLWLFLSSTCLPRIYIGNDLLHLCGWYWGTGCYLGAPLEPFHTIFWSLVDRLFFVFSYRRSSILNIFYSTYPNFQSYHCTFYQFFQYSDAVVVVYFRVLLYLCFSNPWQVGFFTFQRANLFKLFFDPPLLALNTDNSLTAVIRCFVATPFNCTVQ